MPTTCIPRSPRSRAISRPSPEEAPVTMATSSIALSVRFRAFVTPLTVKLAVPTHLLVLIGGGEFSFGETREIDEFLVRHMPADRRTVAFVPAASGSAEYATHLGAYFKQIDPLIETMNVPIYRPRDARRQKNLNYLLAAGM